MNYPLTNQDKTDNIDVAYEEFLVKFKRLDFIENYHDAFLLVLSTIRTSNTNRKEDICALGIKMLETNIRKIWKRSLFKGYGELKLDYDYGFCSDWLIDRAIEAQFTKAKIQNKRVYIGRFPGYSWHSYYFANMGANYSLRYVPNLFAQKQDVDKMLNAIGIRLIVESMRCSMNQHGRKIRLDGGEYMVKVENASDPDEFSSTEIFLDREQLVKDSLKSFSKDKTAQDDIRGREQSASSQISEIVESLANSKAEGKSQSSNTHNEDGQANDKSSQQKGNSSKGTLSDDTREDTTYKNTNTPSSVNWNKAGKYILIIILVIVIMIIASALGIKLPPWFLMLFKYL